MTNYFKNALLNNKLVKKQYLQSQKVTTKISKTFSKILLSILFLVILSEKLKYENKVHLKINFISYD